MNPRTKRRALITLGILLGLTILGVAFAAWRSHVIQAQERRNFQAATEYLAAGQAAEALAVINNRNRTRKKQTREEGEKWRALLIDVLVELEQTPRMLALYERHPRAFDNHEKANLLVARAMLHTRNFEAFEKLRQEWASRQTLTNKWHLLAADALLLRGQRDEAVKLLESRPFEGPADSGRLARLALLHSSKNLKKSWDLLAKAYDADPANADIRLFRAQILESIGQPMLAQPEYLAAHLVKVENPFMRDQLADFYRRNGMYDHAVLTWANGLTNSSHATDFIWLNAKFWSSLTRTVQFDWANAEAPPGEYRPFVQYLLDLPANAFWDEKAFEKIPESRRFDQDLQEVYWLRLLAALKDGREDEAVQLLQFNRFRADSWSPDIESALLRVLVYRQTGALRYPVGIVIPPSRFESRHQMLEQLDQLTKNPSQKPAADLEALLRSKQAFAAIFLAGGWAEAGLKLLGTDKLPESFPEWTAYGFTQAFRLNHGNRAALEFAAKQKTSPQLDYLVGEILLADGQTAAGLKKLGAMAGADSDVGFRAAHTLAQFHIGRKEPAEAVRIIQAQPRLSKSVVGKELIASSLLLEGRKDQAEQLLSSIEKESSEAKAYFARKAFDQKDWPRARKLTEELLALYPARLDLRANLEAIIQAEAAR